MQAIKSAMGALDEFPCVSMPCRAADRNYQTHALTWQATAGKISMWRCASSFPWFNERILLSRYAHVPLGNFELDWVLFTADVFFSRALRDHQQILWVSDDGNPDLGGIYEGDTCFIDEVSQPTLSNFGAYRRVSVELKVHHLAINSLLKSSQVDELVGGSTGSFDLDNHGSHVSETDIDDGGSCTPAFLVLKQVIQRCIADAVESGNVFADAILQHLYRWLCSPLSKLHDPSLHRLLHNVMKKVFALLLGEFRKLGATIIFANFSRVIIDTGKLDLVAARTYCDCLLKGILKRDLFEWIELEPLHFWHSFLFMDQYNFGGIRARTGAASPGNSTDEFNIDIVSSWNIAECLPKEIQEHFDLIVSQFLLLPWKYLKEQVTLRATACDENSCTPSITITSAENLEGQLSRYLQDEISNNFTSKLLRVVEDILLHFKGRRNSASEEQLEGPADRHAQKGDTALQFIKHICVVLSLDQSIQQDIQTMRRNLLKLVRTKEFAPEAQFLDMGTSFTLPNVICSFCNDCRDLDLCRDSVLLGQEWCCIAPQCGQPYNHEQMENGLLQIVRQRERLYHLQDLVCQRCRQVKAAHLAEQCTCGGSFQCREDSTEYLNRMRIFLEVAVEQNFRLLQDCISWILEAR